MNDKQTKTATITFNNQSIELPILTGSNGDQVIDISTLGKYGIFTFDPGFLSTASCASAITYTDGEKGKLSYRGYPIEQLAVKSHFLEIGYLLLHGELPQSDQMDDFEKKIAFHSMLHEQIMRFYTGFRRDAHPMAVMVGVIGALSAFYHEEIDINNREHQLLAAYRMIAKMPTIAAACYKYSIGQPIVYPHHDFTYAENFLHMLFATPCNDYTVNPILSKALDKILILHADHEQNASTSTVRITGSSGANPFACIAAGIASLWGPAHGGANEAVINMLKQIGTPDRIPEFIARAKDSNDPFRLMGFGHRVYKNFDPRAKVMRETCHEVLAELGIHEDPLFAIAQQLEKIALEDDYFISRKLYPNVDFYSGIVLSAIGIPANMFTVIFALARTVGWLAHWIEMINEPGRKIARPRQLYVGSVIRDFPS